MLNGLKNIPKNVLRKWGNVVQDTKDMKLLDNADLLNSLERIIRNSMREAHERVKGIIFASPQI